MKKRILSILLTLCMVLCLVPTTAFAAGGAKAILPGTSAQSILKIDKSRLSFAGHEWWVIGQKTDKSNNAPIITLLAVNNDFGDVPFRTGSAVPFENARRYSEDNGYYANNPSDMSQWRKPNEYAGSTLQQKMVSLAEAIPEKEQAVIRPKDITEGITGQEVKAQKLWAFSQEDSIYLYRNSCKYAAQWWTRSSNEVYGYGSWTIHPDGRSGSALNVDYDAAVRPAMEMDLSSVLFISAAEHGKVADLTTPIAEYAGDEWKLTLHDSDRDDFTAKTVLVNGSVLEVEYKNAKVGDNEYISAVIKDADGSISRYTRVVQLDGTTNGTRGRAAIDLTGIDMTGKTLCVFNEQFNGDHKTDYAGALREVKLTDEIDEQFTLAPGGRYYFDLSAMNIPGTANGGNSDGAVSLPDTSLHYVPFTYVGTIEAYKLTSATATTEEYAQQNKYPHSLFVADYAVTHTISWGGLNDEGLIFGKNYASGGVDYTLRAPSVGSISTGSGDSQRGVPQSNEWDTMLNKNSGYIQNWNKMYSWGQDTSSAAESFRAYRGYNSVRFWYYTSSSFRNVYLGFRPVLEVLNPGTLGSDGLKVVTLDLGGGKLGGSSDAIHIIVKNGSTFTAPMSGGLTRPDGDTGSYFMWLDGNGNSYEPGDSVPADVTTLTAQWTAPTYAVTLNTNGGTINSGNVTSYTYGVGATLPTAGDMTYTGHTFVGWYDNENLTGNPVTAISSTETGNKEYWAKWEANTYPVTFYPTGGSSSSKDRDDPSGNAFITDRPNKDNPTTPTTAKSNPVKVDSKGNAVITRSIVADVISVAQSDSIKHGNTKNGIAVVVPVEISKALAGVQITLKADALDKLVSSGVKRFTIDTDSMADFGFMLDTLKELNRQTTGDLILKMKKTAVTSQEAETAIGNRPVYDITLWEVKNSKETAVDLSGKTVSIAIPYTPAKNEQPGNLYAVYVDENGNVQWISKSSYNMDQKAVIFVAEHFSIYGIGYKNQIPAFTDVNNHWAKDNMLFVVSRGLLSGTSATTFSPNTGMTRGMFVTALGRLAGVDPTDYQASMFTDVKEDAYYAPYVNWAAKTGVVSGTTDTTFAPDANINREQMAVIMKNYATKLGYTIPKTLEVVNFADSAGISSWAKEAVKSMQQAGILAGKTNNCFDPAGTATRAEVATVLRRFVEIVIDPQTANGWVQNDSGEWSYYKNGDLVKGWLSNDQKWYWLDKNTGKMFSGGWKQIDGKQYYFYADGSMAVNTTVDGKTIGADGARK